jgi:hypothetical protein
VSACHSRFGSQDSTKNSNTDHQFFLGVVDGASWRLGNAIGGTQKYPDFLLSGDSAPRAAGQQKATL